MTSTTTALVQAPQPLPWQRILVIEDDRTMQARLQRIFQPEGYWIELAEGGSQGRELLRNPPPSVVVLDLQTTNASARRLFEETRTMNPDVPIVVLGASSSVIERVLFLELGADDYVVKPFNDRELLARVRAAIRRSEGPCSDIFNFGDVQIDFRKMEVRRQGRLASFTALEFKVLKFMTRNAERVISREELLNEVWGYQNYPTTRTVDNHILRLRQKLELQPSYPVHFLTVHGVGYKFVPHSVRRSAWTGIEA